jgi:hypothetical protein
MVSPLYTKENYKIRKFDYPKMMNFTRHVKSSQIFVIQNRNLMNLLAEGEHFE